MVCGLLLSWGSPCPELEGRGLAPPPASSFAEASALDSALEASAGGAWVLTFLSERDGTLWTGLCTFIASVFLFLWPLQEMSRFTKRKAEDCLFLQINALAFFFFMVHIQKIIFVLSTNFCVQ